MRSLIFAGGGTGGHLYPALAIREAFEPGARSLFLCSDRPLDARILAKEDVPFRQIRARPIASSPKAIARLLLAWGGAVRASRDAIRAEKATGAECVVVAMGGYVAAPVVQAARAEGVPVVLVNLDAVPGKANRWIARRARTIVSAAPVGRSGWTEIPPIVRRDAMAPGDGAECRRMLGLDPDRPTVLVCGGSQGARSINLFMAAFVDRHRDLLRPWQVIHQCGDKDEDDVRYAYEASSVPALVTPFLDPMGPAWGAADLAVSRAGAGSVGEAWANRVPTIFMPYPFHKDQHQKRNAAVLVEAGGAVVVEDRIEAGANAEREAGEALRRLLGDAGARAAMRTALAGLGTTNGAEQVAGAIRTMERHADR